MHINKIIPIIKDYIDKNTPDDKKQPYSVYVIWHAFVGTCDWTVRLRSTLVDRRIYEATYYHAAEVLRVTVFEQKAICYKERIHSFDLSTKDM